MCPGAPGKGGSPAACGAGAGAQRPLPEEHRGQRRSKSPRAPLGGRCLGASLPCSPWAAKLSYSLLRVWPRALRPEGLYMAKTTDFHASRALAGKGSPALESSRVPHRAV